jgi:hypothetical protein
MEQLAENGLASLEFWLSFTTTLVLVVCQTPWRFRLSLGDRDGGLMMSMGCRKTAAPSFSKGSPWIVYALWRGRDVDELLFGEYAGAERGSENKNDKTSASNSDGNMSVVKRNSNADDKSGPGLGTAGPGRRGSKVRRGMHSHKPQGGDQYALTTTPLFLQQGSSGHGKKRKHKQSSGRTQSVGSEPLSDHHESDEASGGVLCGQTGSHA